MSPRRTEPPTIRTIVTAEAATEKRRYHTQLAIVDGVGFGLALAGAAKGPDGIVFGVAGMALGGPLVHLTHDRPGRALLSFTARVGLPVATAMLRHCTDPNFDPDEDLEPDCENEISVPTGLILGAIAASIIDQVLVPPARPVPAGTSVSPTVAPIQVGATVGLVGTF